MFALSFLLCEDELRLQRLKYLRRIRNLRRLVKLGRIPDEDFVKNFGLNKPTFYKLCDDLQQHTTLKGTRRHPIEIKILCTLGFLATGTHKKIQGITQHLLATTVNGFIMEVVNALVTPNFVTQWIKFPGTREARNKVKQQFQRLFKFPGVVGCVDCTHIPFVPPGVNDHFYYNRRNQCTKNVQLVCDANLEIMDFDGRFGGGTYDSFIWTFSRPEVHLRKLHQAQEHVWFLGDASYTQRPWLMVPIKKPTPGTPEETYAQRHTEARKCMERCIELLKSRWKCLQTTLNFKPSEVGWITLACCVLHNIALAANPPPEIPATGDNVGDVQINIPTNVKLSEHQQGVAFRNDLLTKL